MALTLERQLLFIKKKIINGYKGNYRRLFDNQGEVESVEARKQAFLAGKGQFTANQGNFSKIPGLPVAYWVTPQGQNGFIQGTLLSKIAQPKQGMVTRDNNRFMRLWWEVSDLNFEQKALNHDMSEQSDKKWYPCTSGGSYRKWYGNNESVVNFKNDGKEIIDFSGSHIKNREFYFRECVTWSAISSAKISLRYAHAGFLPEHAGNCLYGTPNQLYVLQAFSNSAVGLYYLSILSPTLNYNVGDIANLPIICDESKKQIIGHTENARNISQKDWDSYETSWDFKKSPLV